MERNITDSGQFDLARLTASIQPVPLHPKPDDSLLGIAGGPLPPARAEPRAKPKLLLPALAFVAMFGSMAFALHTSQRAMELATATATSSEVETSGGELAVAPEAEADIVPEAELAEDADPKREAEVVLVPRAEAAVIDRARLAGPSRTLRSPPAAPERELGERDVDELLRLATGLPLVPNTEPTATDAEPLRTLRPDRAEVARVFRALAPAVQECATEAEGVVTARVFLVGATGRARSASITGAAGTSAACMEAALMNAEVQPFLQERLEITFPYRL